MSSRTKGFRPGALLLAIAAAAAVLASGAGGAAAAAQIEGHWTAEAGTAAGSVHFTVSRTSGHGQSMNSSDVAASTLQGLDPGANGVVRFRMTREAGTFECEGWMKGGRGAGNLVFQPNAAFAQQLRQRGYAAPDDEDMFRYATADLTLAFVDEMRSLGFEREEIEQIRRMKTHGVTGRFVTEIRALGYTPEAEEIVRLVNHDVTPEFVREVRALGFTPDLGEVVRMKNHDVTPEYIKKLRARGFEKITIGEAIRLKNHGLED